VEIRELEYATGQVQAASNRKSGTHEFAVLVTIPESRGPEESPWEGMSGAAAWASGRLIGVIGQHHPREGLATLTIRPVDGLSDLAMADGLDGWRQALPETAAELWLATPPTERQLTVERARQAARPITPPVLIARQSELDELARLVTSPAEQDRWRWIQGEAFAGKTALLAYFAQHPPDQVDIAACFLRRTTRENSPDYALDVLAGQLAAIAALPYQPVGINLAAFEDLLAKAARACREQGRHLAVLVDGLDEYKTVYAGLGLRSWLPGTDNLPEGAHLIAASRSSAEVQPGDGHPLWRYQAPLTRSDAASQIEARAQQEIEQVTLEDRDALSVLAIFTTAETGLSPTEVTALTRMRPNAQGLDEATVRRLLHTAFGRTLTRQGSSQQPRDPVFAFAHDTLLDAARKHEDVLALLPECQRLLDQWADEYAERGWPGQTPRYLLLPYTELLTRRLANPATEPQICRQLAKQLYYVVSHPERLPRIATAAGNPALADREITTTQQALLDTRERTGLSADDLLYRLAVLAFRRRPLDGTRAEVARTIAGVWARCGRADEALMLAGQILDPPERSDTFGDLAELHCEAGRLEEALAIAQQMSGDNRSETVLRDIASAFAAAGLPDRGLAVAGQLKPADPGLPSDEQQMPAHNLSWVLIDVVKEYAAERRTEDAVAVAQRALNEITKFNYSPLKRMHLTNLSSALASISPVQAMAAAREIAEASGRARAFIEVAKALAQGADPESAQIAVAEALTTARDIPDLPQRAEALVEVASALGEAGYPEHALTAAEDGAAAARSIPDVSTRAQALATLAKLLKYAGYREQALPAAKDALTDAGHIVDPAARARSLAVIAMVLCDSDDYTELARTAASGVTQNASQISDPALRSECLFDAAKTMINSKEPSLGLAAAQEAHAAAVQIDDPRARAKALFRVAYALHRVGEDEEELGAIKDGFRAVEAISPGARRSTIYGYASGIMKTFMTSERALAVAEVITDPEVHDFILSEFATKIADPEWPQQASDVAGKIIDHNERAKELAWQAEAAAQRGDCEQALTIAQQAFAITDYAEEDRAKVLSIVAVKLARGGHSAMASRLIADALAALEMAPDTAVQSDGLAEIVAESAASAGHPEQAISAAQRLKDPWAKARAFTDVASRLADARQAEASLAATRQAIDAIQAADENPYFYKLVTTLIKPLVTLLKPKQAMGVVRRFEKVHQRLDAEVSVAVAIAEAGDFDSAVALTRRIPNLAWRTEAITRIAKQMIIAGSLERAGRTAAEALVTARKIKHRTDRNEMLADVAGTLLIVGDIDRALIAARLIDDPFRRIMAIVRIAGAMADAISRGGPPQIYQGDHWRYGDPRPDDEDLLAAALADHRRTAIAVAAGAVTDATPAQAARRILSEALAGHAEIEDSEEHDQATVLIAAVLADAGDLEQALSTGRGIGDPAGQAQAMLAVALAMARANLPERSVEIGLNGMSVRSRTDDGDELEKHYWNVDEVAADLAAQLAYDGYIDQSLEFALQIRDSLWLNCAIAYIAGVLTESGNQERALETAAQIRADFGGRHEIVRHGTADMVIDIIIRLLAERGQAETVKSIILRQGGTAKKRAQRFTSIAPTLEAAGKPLDALEAIEIAITSAAQVDDPSDQTSLLENISKLLDRATRPSDGVVAERILNMQPRIQGILLMNPNLTSALKLLPVGVLNQLVADRVIT
jgi:tetratricopeptide (TPR) repeat protein